MSHNSTNNTDRKVYTGPMSFSVLMSIYSATKASDLNLCLKSLSDQQLLPNQVVLVRDGPVEPDVEKCIDKFSGNLPFEHLVFPVNRGLGWSLNDGLEACENELVARVDSDDYSVPSRFYLQYSYLMENPTISVVGGWMTEYYLHGTRSSAVVRKTPIDPLSISKHARLRNPVNHPTAMFRKSHVLESGSYQPCLLFEDYFLWARMLMAGYQIANVPKVLVETHVDLHYFIRRGGFSYLKQELHLLKKLRCIGFLSGINVTKFVLSRLPMRLVPTKLRQYLYRTLLRHH